MGPKTMQQDKQRMVELLEANHHFPGHYHISLVTLNEMAVVLTVRALVEEGGGPVPDADWQTRLSSGGKYASHRVRVFCDTAHEVLALYGRLHGTPGLLSIL
jgi:putative lipoic acid-binding regulatory protein